MAEPGRSVRNGGIKQRIGSLKNELALCLILFGKNNEKTVIQFDNEKRKKMDFLRLLFIAAVIAAFAIIFFSKSDRLNHLLFGLILGCGGLMRYYIKTVDKENAGLVISSQGIVFNGTELGRKLGLIAWKDIEAVGQGEGECLYVRLKDPERYTGKTGGEDMEQVMKKGIEIRAEGLKINFEGMEQEIRRYFEQQQQG
ncbi:MAG: hypothetical protein LBI90_02795 [Treponema sp.]|nr:hypothetical protein [Treponema sp.]